MAQRVRSFVAIELNAELLRAIEGLQKQLQNELPRGALRWVRPEGIHLTLQFLGNVQVEDVPAIIRALGSACSGVPPLTFHVAGLGCFPNPHRPRVLWVGVDEPSGQLARLQKRVEEALEPLGFPPERRGFHPHLTLARAARNARPADLRQVGGRVVDAPPIALGAMTAHYLSLMESDLRPDGAVYTRLAEVSLEG